MKIIDRQMISHMALSSEHIHMVLAKVYAPGHIMHGREVCVESVVKKRESGKTDIGVYLNEMGSKMFDSEQEFIDYYTTVHG